MSDEIQKPATEEVPQYVPQPRGDARIAGINTEAVDARLAEVTDFFLKHCDEADYRNLDWYLWRMQLKYAVGDDIVEVVDDAFLAAKCLHDKHAMHLELKPPEMFMTRRITPVELGIISGMPMLTLEFSAVYGLPLMMVLGQTAPEDILNEANIMTSFFRRGFCADFREFTGLSAVIYAGVIAAIGRGFDDEATLGLNTYAKARDSLRGMPPAALLPKIKRYDALNTALACLCAGNFELIGDILAPEAEAFAEEQARRSGTAWLNPDKMPPPKYFDLSILTILALAALRGKIIELPKTGAIAHYNDFMRGFSEMPERRLDDPVLDEETRRILQEAGVDPNQLGVDHTFQDEKEASEARAAELFEEKQRQAQEAVRAKIAQGIAAEEAHTSVQPQKLTAEKLKLHDSDENTEEKSRSFDHFFDDDDKADAAARRANDETFDGTLEQTESHQNYAAFFEGDDDPRTEINEEEEKTSSANKTQDFSAFFKDDDAEDASIRAHVEAENTQAADTGKNYASFFDDMDDKEDASIRAHVEEETSKAQDTGKSYASFFDNLDEDAIPKFDDGTQDADAPKAREYSAAFFSDETVPLSGLKMTLEPETKPETKESPAPVQSTESSVYEPTVEDNSPRRDFTKLFDDDVPAPTQGLRMSLDDEENEAKIKAANQNIKSDLPKQDEGEALTDNSPRRDFTKLFDDDVPAPTQGLRMSLDDEENEAKLKAANQNIKSDLPKQDEGEALTDNSPRRDFTKLFEADETASATTDAETERQAQLRELEEEQARRAQKTETQTLKLSLDGTETEVKVAESYQQRMTRLIAEKQAAAREMALREREEAERELEELKRTGVAKPVVEQLQLTPTESTDPDEQVKKVGPEDLVIKGFAYTDLDMIHANTAIREDVEEDFDMHAAMAQKAYEEAVAKAEAQKAAAKDSKSTSQDEDDDLHVVIDYAALTNSK